MKQYLVLRTPSGVSGDMIVTGLAKVGNFSETFISRMIQAVGLPALQSSIKIRKILINKISGWRMTVKIEDGHHHRSLKDVRRIILKSRLSLRAKKLAQAAFSFLAEAEGAIHGVDPEDVTFHEVGALDSILDICLASALFDEIACDQFFCSPLPLCDGKIQCAHGVFPAPAPATLYLLKGIPVYGIDSEGETVTPTAISLLKAFGAKFGQWPALTLKNVMRVYGGRILPNVPNGAVFAVGIPLTKKSNIR